MEPTRVLPIISVFSLNMSVMPSVQPRQLLGAADEPPGRDLIGHGAQHAPLVPSRVGRGSEDPGIGI
jgi:hypothetical protein